jgi:hypothetical protein
VTFQLHPDFAKKLEGHSGVEIKKTCPGKRRTGLNNIKA